ncbi:MAG: sensor histidine kinase [Streptosporangiaceae bacterium]
MIRTADVTARTRQLTAVATPGDVFLAAVTAGVQVGGSAAISARHGPPIGLAGYLLLAAGPAALLARRRFPATVLWVTVAAAVAFAGAERARGLPYLALIIAFVNAVLAGRRWAAITSLVVSYLGILWLPGLTGTGPFPSAALALGIAAWHLTLLSGAEWYRGRRQRAAALAQGRAEADRRRASEERLRIARDLHDVVAHSLAVINVQANTALHLIDQQPDRARSTLSVINDVSKQALVELRTVLGVLRQDTDELPRSPAPSLARVSELISGATAAGITVRVREEGANRDLPAHVDLAGYRILQEALTNSARHAAGAAVAVRLVYGPGDLVIQVDDDGARSPHDRPDGAGGGNGIPGMTERARALGGTLRAGPRPGGGFRVRARLPLGAPAS